MRWPGARPSSISALPQRLTCAASSAYVTSPVWQRIAILPPRPSRTWRSMNGAAALKPGAKCRTEGDRERSTVTRGSSMRLRRLRAGPLAHQLAQRARRVGAGDRLAPAQREVGVLHRLGDARDQPGGLADRVLVEHPADQLVGG